MNEQKMEDTRSLSLSDLIIMVQPSYSRSMGSNLNQRNESEDKPQTDFFFPKDISAQGLLFKYTKQVKLKITTFIFKMTKRS